MSDIYDLASSLFGTKRVESRSDSDTSTIYATAVGDSEDGTVEVYIGDDVVAEGEDWDDDGNQTSEGSGVTVELPTVPSVSDGDELLVTLVGGTAKTPIITGNVGEGDRQNALIEAAQTVADEAAAVANATNQHFFSDSGGVHVTEAEGDATTEHNILINSLGILLRKATNYLVSITASAIAFFDGDGTGDDNITAEFGADGATIGKKGGVHSVITNSSFKLLDGNATEFAEMELMNDADTGLVLISFECTTDGTRKAFTVRSSIVSIESVTKNGNALTVGTDYTVSDRTVTFATAPESTDEVWINYYTDEPIPSFTFGTRASSSSIGKYSIAEGSSVESSSLATHAEGMGTHAGETCAHAEGYSTVASGKCTHAEGNGVTASGDCAHAEGNTTESSGLYSHAEGGGSTASGSVSHAEGYVTVASGTASHAEGYMTAATGGESHAGGLGTVAAGQAQTAIGKYNVSDTGSAFIIGNGSGSSNRSNALTVDWDGNLAAAGDLGGATATVTGDAAVGGDLDVTGTITGNWDGHRKTYFNATNVSIAAGGAYYLNLGSARAVSGYDPTSVVVEVAGMSNLQNLVASTLMTNGSYLWSRVYNSGSSASAGSINATLHWMK